jgi:hypothetical protein
MLAMTATPAVINLRVPHTAGRTQQGQVESQEGDTTAGPLRRSRGGRGRAAEVQQCPPIAILTVVLLLALLLLRLAPKPEMSRTDDASAADGVEEEGGTGSGRAVEASEEEARLLREAYGGAAGRPSVAERLSKKRANPTGAVGAPAVTPTVVSYGSTHQ